MDKYLSVRSVKLSVNTRSDAMPSTNRDEIVFDQKRLYMMFCRNVRRFNLGFADVDLTFEQWRDNFSLCIITVDDISALLPSPNIMGKVNIHGDVVVQNRLGYAVGNGA
jgi:hypothetical protein